MQPLDAVAPLAAPPSKVDKAAPSSPVASGGNASGDSSVDEWGNSGSGPAGVAPLAPALAPASSTSPTAAAAAAAAAFESAGHHHRHEDHHDDDLAAHLGLDGVSWPWEGGGGGGEDSSSLAALKTTTMMPQLQQQRPLAAAIAAATATNSGGSNSSGVASQSHWTNLSSAGNDFQHGASVSPRSEGETRTTTAAAAAAAAEAQRRHQQQQQQSKNTNEPGVFHLPNPPGGSAAAAAAAAPPQAYVTVPLPVGAPRPPGALVLASNPSAAAPAAGHAPAPGAPAPAAAVLSQLHAQHQSLLATASSVPVTGYRAASSRPGLFASVHQQHQQHFAFATPNSAAVAARAALSVAADSSSVAVVGPSVPDIPDAWAAAALCDELVDLGEHPGAHRGDPWRRRSLSFNDLAAAEAAATSAAASAAAASVAATHVAETSAAVSNAIRRFIRPETATVAAAASVAGNTKRRFSNVGGRNSIEQQRFGNIASAHPPPPPPPSVHLPLPHSDADLATLLPLSALGAEDDEEGAESDSGWTPAVAAARRRFDSERGAAAAGERRGGANDDDDANDESHLHPPPPVAPPQIKRARSVSCLTSHGACGGLLPVVLSKATAEAAAASRMHRDEAMMTAQLRWMGTKSTSSNASPPCSPSAFGAGSSSPAPPRPPSRQGQQQQQQQQQQQLQRRNPFSSSSSGSAAANAAVGGSSRSTAAAAAAAAAGPCALPPPPPEEEKEEGAKPSPPPPPPPGFWLTAPPIPKERGVLPDEVCWARLLSYPWWPAIVKDPPPPSAFALRHKPESVFVVFFGDGNCAWLSPRSLDRFACGYAKRSSKPRKDLQRAVDEAWGALGVARPIAVATDAAGGASASASPGGEQKLVLPEGFDESRPALAPHHF